MAIFVDLDEEPFTPPPISRFHDATRDTIHRDLDTLRSVAPRTIPSPPPPVAQAEMKASKDESAEKPTMEELYLALDTAPDLRVPAAIRAFACYPVAVEIVSHVDLNTLDNLARSCRQIHEALIQFHGALMRSTLHCARETQRFPTGEIPRAMAPYGGCIANYCARDMVSECRRCGTVVCRNCVIKPPATPALKGRHRRLCLDCTKAPLTTLFVPPLDENLANRELVKHAMCTCATDGVWLCQDCGRGTSSSDSLYQRLWTWRLSYGEIIGGLGTGIGDGDRGVICGRESRCLAAKEREHEIDCDAEDRRTPSPPIGSPYVHHHYQDVSLPTGAFLSTPGDPLSPSPASSGGSASPQHALGVSQEPLTVLDSASARLQLQAPITRRDPGYARHQIEGVGGQLRTKLVRMVRVGASVPEWQDERGRKVVLEKEINGKARSWCGWCWRPIPGEKDRVAFA